MYSHCRNWCTMEDRCTSINMVPREKNEIICQLSDSDQLQHPNDLKPTAGLIYRGTEVRIVCCSSALFTFQDIFPKPSASPHRIRSGEFITKLFKLEPENIAIEPIIKKDRFRCPVGFISIDGYQWLQAYNESSDHHVPLAQGGSAIIDILK